MITTTRLRRIADDDIGAACALARANLRGGRYAWAGVPPSLLLATFIECFDIWPAWPNGNFDNTASRRVILHSAFTSEDTWPKSSAQLLPCGEPVGTRRRLAVVLCNLWRRLPAPHPVEFQCAFCAEFKDIDGCSWCGDTEYPAISVALPGHSLRGYVEELKHLFGDGWLRWLAKRLPRCSRVSYASTAHLDSIKSSDFTVWHTRLRFGHVSSCAHFDASCLPVVPMSVAGGE